MAKIPKDKRFIQAVELARDGSGSRVIFMPNPEILRQWIGKLHDISGFNYGKLTLVVQTLHDAPGDYDGIPGCAIFLFPSNKEGRLGDGDGRTAFYDFSPEAYVRGSSITHLHTPAIVTNYSDLKNLRDALTRALRNMRRRKVKK